MNMHALRPVPPRLWQLVKLSVNNWIDDGASSMGAALAYYTVFSLAPLLLMVIAVAGLFFGQEIAQGALMQEFDALIGSNGAQAIQAILKSAQNWEGGVISMVVSAITLFIGATTVFAELQRDLDLIWKAEKKAVPGGVWGFVRTRLLSFGLILGVGFLLIVSLALSAGIAALSTVWGDWLKNLETLLQIVNFAVSFAVITALFALIYKVLPNARIGWGDVWMGATVTSLLFSLGKFAIGLYIGKSAISSSFGAAGAFVVLIAWIYYSAQIFLLGAEFTYVYTCTRGSGGPDQPVATTRSR
jgi:membrane protein